MGQFVPAGPLREILSTWSLQLIVFLNNLFKQYIKTVNEKCGDHHRYLWDEYGMSQLLKSSELLTLVPNKQIIATSTSNQIYKLVKRHSALPSKYNNLSMKMQQTIS